MTPSYYVERTNLSLLQQMHPQWSHQQLAATLGRSREWVKKGRKRLREEVAFGLSLPWDAQRVYPLYTLFPLPCKTCYCMLYFY